MGWNIDLETDKPMTEPLIEEIIAQLPEKIRAGGGKQSWGWSLAVDVKLNSEHELALSGSYTLSGKIADSAADAFARQLEKRGYQVTFDGIE